MASQLLQKIYKPRPAWSRKGDFGRLLVVGGSLQYSGSPIFNALAAYRAGCDLVKIAAPEPAAAAAKAYLPDLIAYPVKTEIFGPGHADYILNMQKEADAMVIGGGLGRYPATVKFVQLVLKKTAIPTVIDADAIHAVAASGTRHASGSKQLAQALRLGKNFVLTPHSHEFFVLSGKKPGSDVEERKKLTQELASRLNSVILLKGHIDVISDGKRTATNNTGSTYMTKGGFGDTLAGIVGALLARGIPTYDAACAAAWINGRAGELAAKKFGEGMLASDLINEIPHAIR